MTGESVVDDADIEALATSVREVLAEECDSATLHRFVDGAEGLPTSLWRLASELGWFAAAVPKDCGGLGFGVKGAAAVHRELGARCAPGPIETTLIAARWLSELPGGQGVVLLEEIAAGRRSIAVPASPNQEGSLTLSGDRLSGETPVLFGLDADLAIASADGRFVLIDMAAATPSPFVSWDKTRRLGRVCLEQTPAVQIFDVDATVGLGALKAACSLAVAADCVGGAEAIAERTVAYMKERVQFGRPVASFQALKHRAANIAIRNLASRHLLGQAVEAAELNSPHLGLWSALAKADASNSYALASNDGVQLHGGVGFTWEYDCHFYLKRAKLNEFLGGDNRRERDLAMTGLIAAANAGETAAELTQ